MQPISESTLRTSFVNASLRERTNLTTPPHFDAIDWGRIDFLGWRDDRVPSLGYVVAHLDGQQVGILLRQAEGRARSRAQCSWCEDIQLPNDVVLFSARRSGPAGRNGDTVGTLVCERFQCSTNVRKRPPVAYLGFDVEAARERRIDALRQHVSAFLGDIRDHA
jgi:FBP C-terminal treble-clef zinc-finger